MMGDFIISSIVHRFINWLAVETGRERNGLKYKWILIDSGLFFSGKL